ncbi:MAG: hypothetical protein Q8K93_11385 [Reyranella sp.]|uniref:hypothetical protein n=1 Tax=Reyranella sp. TaxID=1929291 RepID=UPI0027301C44|nr:hypothetical protein [Reyranella sp.]MDP1962789.1 hypothetical protein [Reyranella sp.]MDP2375802.1 hypothetical protein [Reyranella sp.]
MGKTYDDEKTEGKIRQLLGIAIDLLTPYFNQGLKKLFQYKKTGLAAAAILGITGTDVVALSGQMNFSFGNANVSFSVKPPADPTKAAEPAKTPDPATINDKADKKVASTPGTPKG